MFVYSAKIDRACRPESVLAAKIVTREHARFDEARQAWNLAVDQQPAAVVFPDCAEDVAAAVVYAIEHGLRVAPQGTGHNAGPLGSLEDTLLLKTERMRGVQIDANARLARVEAGSVWLEVVEAAARHGLAALAGSSPDVGVVGYALGGGISFLSRKYGLCANAVRAIELVTADGRLVCADRDNEPDLFWALRGGGGSFGVVTAVELELFAVEHAYAGVLFYPIERGSEVLHAWRELTQSDALPDELTTIARFLRLPPIPDIPELPARAVDAFVEVAGQNATFPLVTVELRHLEGALRRPHHSHGALSSIEARYALFAAGMVPVSELQAPVRAQLHAVKTAIGPWAASHMYLNFAETQHDPASLWTEQAYHRLRRIKRTVDPHDVIRSNHPIPAAR